MLNDTERKELAAFKSRFTYAEEVRADDKTLNRIVGNDLYREILKRCDTTRQTPWDVVVDALGLYLHGKAQYDEDGFAL